MAVYLGLNTPLWAQPAVLFAIPTESRVTHPLRADRPWHLELQARDLDILARTLGEPVPPAGATTLDYRLDQYPIIAVPGHHTWRESSFAVDYQEPDVISLVSAFKKKVPQPWSRQLIADFIHVTMKTSYGHGFDIASQVAHAREGDCTEYAVLTTAVARALGFKARIALGLLLIQTDAGFAAFGHAWTEVEEGERWVVTDATAGAATIPVRYLPLGILEDEGPGFGMELGRLTRGWVQRVIALDDEE